MRAAFHNPLARGSSDIIAKARSIKQWARQALAIPDDAVVSVNEISCALPDCPPKETVILVMSNGDTIQVSIHKAMADVLEHDVADAFRALQHS
jgi:hypothetical protein